MTILYEDLEKLEKITKVTYLIEALYKKFIKLEQKGMKDSEEYNKCLYYLDVVLDMEKKRYNNPIMEVKQCIKLDELLYHMTDVSEFSDEYIINQKYDKRVVGRIKNNLLSISIKDNKTMPNYISDEDFNFLDNICLIESNSELNLKLAFIYLLDKYINNDKYKNVKNELIEAKYSFIFTNKEVEKILVKNKFMLEDIIYIDNFYNILEDDKINIIKEFAQLCYLEHSEKLLKIEDLDYNDNSKFIVSILRQCFIRASFVLMNNDSIEDLNDYFHELIDSEKFTNKYPNSNISQNLIIECFRKVRKDRVKVRVLK